MSTLRINNIEAQSIPASPTIDEKVKVTNSSGDILVNIDGKTSGITTIGINTTDGNIKFDANSNVLIAGILTATTLSGNFTPTSLEVGSNIKLGNAGVITATRFVGSVGTFTGDTAISGSLQVADTIQHEGDVNTKIRFPANDTITAETSGVERLRISSSGKVGIDMTNPDAYDKFVVSGTGNVIAARATSGAAGLGFYENNTGRFFIKSLNGSDGISFVDGDNSSERLRITSGGMVGIAHHVEGQIGKELTIRPANSGGIRYVRPGETSGSPNIHLDLTTTTSGSAFPTGEAYTVKYKTYNCDQIFETYEGGGTGGNISFRTRSSSVESVRINKDGYVTKPNQPMFAAHGSGDAIAAATPLPFDSIVYNIGSHYNNSTHKFTCPVAGYYYVTCHVVPTGFSNSNQNVELYVQNTAGSRFFLDRKVKTTNYASNNFSVGGSRIIYAAANDTFCVEFNSISGSPTLEGSSHFGIILMA